MKIHQITDLHIPEEGCDDEFAGVKGNIERQLAYVKRERPDLLVVSGDLSMVDGSVPACRWLEARLPKDIDTVIMAGNHDNPAVLWDVFGQARCRNPKLFSFEARDGLNLVFLNTSDHTVPDCQLKLLSCAGGRGDTLLFMHHPPDEVSGGFMDRTHQLKDWQRIQKAIRQAQVKHVFAGHYHHPVDKPCDGFTLHIAPSPAFQIDLHEPVFASLPFTPAVRVINATAQQVVTELVEV